MRSLPLLVLALALPCAARDYPRLTVTATPSFTADGVEFVYSGEADYPDGTVIMCCVEYMGQQTDDSWGRGHVEKGKYEASSNPIPATKRVFAGGSSLLGPDDVADWHAFLAKISEDGKGGAACPAKRLWSLLEDATRKEIEKALKSATIDPAEVASAVSAINKVLQRDDFWTSEDFASVGVTDEGQKLLDVKASDRSAWQKERLNRLLLEAAFDDTVLARAPEAPYMAVAVFDWHKQDEDVFPRIVNDPRLKGVREVPKSRVPFQVGTREQEVKENAEMADKLRGFVEPFYRGDGGGKDEAFVDEAEEKYADARSGKAFLEGGRWSQPQFESWLKDYYARLKKRWDDLGALTDGYMVPKYPKSWDALRQTYLNMAVLWKLHVEALFKEHGVDCPTDYMAAPPGMMRPKLESVQESIQKAVDQVRHSRPIEPWAKSGGK